MVGDAAPLVESLLPRRPAELAQHGASKGDGGPGLEGAPPASLEERSGTPEEAAEGARVLEPSAEAAACDDAKEELRPTQQPAEPPPRRAELMPQASPPRAYGAK